MLGRGTRYALVGVLALTLSVAPGPLHAAKAAGIAGPGYAVSDFATGFNTFLPYGPGPVGLAFDSQGNLYSTGYLSGNLYRFPPSGGTFETSLLSNVGFRVTGLAFDKGGRLFVARQSQGDVEQLDPITGSTIATVASGLCNPNAVAVDPKTNDLFISSCGTVQRLSGYQGQPVTPTLYASDVSVDGLTFAPDGTLYGTGGGPIYRITGTADPAPGMPTVIANVPLGDGIALLAPQPGQPITQLVVNTNNTNAFTTNGTIYLVDFSANPATITPIVTGGNRGDFVAVGPDKCLYATQSDEVEKVTAADGSCPFLPTGVAAPPARYVALGDSYSAGEGTYNYLAGTDTSTNRCHRSPDAYPLVLGNGQYGVTLPKQITFAACSGASVSDFYTGGNEAPQLDAICKPQPYVQPSAGAPPPCSDNSVQLVTLSVGGDDAGFKQVIEACVTNRKDQQRCLGQDPFVTFSGPVPDQDAACSPPCVSDNPDPSYAGVEQLQMRLRQLYMDIRARAPHARILVMGYPRIFPVGGANDDSCHLSPRDQSWLTSKDQEMDNVIRFAVNASGVAEYVDTFRSVNAHEACQGLNASIPWINGLVILTHGPFGGCVELSPFAAYCPESFHPTPDGYKAFASSVAVQLLRSPPGTCGNGCAWQSATVTQSDAFQVDVPAGTGVASFSTSWTAKTDIVMSLTAPDGTVYNRQVFASGFNHANGDGYEYYNLPDGDPSNPDPLQASVAVSSGTWTVILSTTATSPVSVTVQVGLAALRDPTPKAEATFDGTLHVPPVVRGAPPPFAIVRFNATAVSDPDGRIVSYMWEFGDGTTGTGAHVEHKYVGPAKYCPLLIVTDESGQIGYASGKVLVATDDPGDCV